eukprot:81175-Alexandrium_andersonii.AAC.1
MSASLVGSEMCIRDSRTLPTGASRRQSGGTGGAVAPPGEAARAGGANPVSYTHLTLPTICSV